MTRAECTNIAHRDLLASFHRRRGIARNCRSGDHFPPKRSQRKLPFASDLLFGPCYGGAKRMGGGNGTRERALPKIFGPLFGMGCHS